jgi:hypothetical protein
MFPLVVYGVEVRDEDVDGVRRIPAVGLCADAGRFGRVRAG